MKTVLCSIIVSSSFLIGYFIKKYLYDKAKFFDEMISIIDLIKVNIQFFQDDISKIFSNSSKYSTYTKKFIDGYKSYLDTNSFDKSIEKFAKLNFLNDQEKDSIYSLFKFLGSSDVDSQCEMLIRYRISIEGYQRFHRDKYQKFGNLALKMSFSVGLLFVILLV